MRSTYRRSLYQLDRHAQIFFVVTQFSKISDDNLVKWGNTISMYDKLVTIKVMHPFTDQSKTFATSL